MAKKLNYSEYVATMDARSRVASAQEVIERLTFQAVELVHLHKSNEIFVYSSKVTDKVDDGRAARALDTIRSACARYEVIRLLAIWDPAEENAVSIPSAIELLSDEAVVALVASDTFKAHANISPRILNPDPDPQVQDMILEAVKQSQESFAMEQSAKAEDRLRLAINGAKARINSDVLVGVRNLRDHFAHSVSQTRREQRGFAWKVKSSEVAEILAESVKIIEEMYCWVNGTSFDISSGVAEQAERYANVLWENFHFSQP